MAQVQVLVEEMALVQEWVMVLVLDLALYQEA